MSDRTSVLTVVLDRDYRVDDIKEVINAILMIKTVAEVRHDITNVETYVAYSRARLDLEKIMFEAIRKETESKSKG